MSPRDKFYEMLTSLSNVPVDERLFVVSDPVAVDGIKTAVYLTPTNASNLYGGRTIEYTRFDLSAVPLVAIKSNNEQYTHELVRRLVRYNIFKYRITSPKQADVTKTRFLTLSERDIVTAVVPRVFSQPIDVLLHADANSDFFVGSLTLRLLPNI